MNKAFSKRLLALSMALLFVLGSLVGCGKQSKENMSRETDEPTNTYIPPVNEDGYIVVTLPIGSTEENSTFFWTSVAANEDGSFKYTFTPEQFLKTKQASYMFGKLIDATTNTYIAEFIKSAEYADVDEDGIPWSLVVSVDRELYTGSELTNSFLVTANVSVYMRMYQTFCGVPDDEWAVHVTVKDADTGDIISEHDFPTRGE